MMVPWGAQTRHMNFASKKLNGFYKDSDLTDREKRLIAENSRLKKRNKRLNGAMLFLVNHVEKRLPFFNARVREANAAKEKVAQKVAPNRITPSPKPQKERKQIIGEAWTPENLNRTKQPRRKDPLSMQQIFAEKKREREESADDTDISNVVFVDQPTEPKTNDATLKKAPLYERSKAEKEEAETSEATQNNVTKLEQEIAESVEVVTVTPAAKEDTDLTPDLAPEEVNILAAPTREKKQDVFHPQPAELLNERKDRKPSAEEASRAYMAVSVASTPVPKTEVLDKQEVSDMDGKDIIADQVARENEVLRAAMLRRVNRLRW